MLLVYVIARLRAPWCRSLKDKRSEIKKLIHKLRQTFNVSVAESGSQDIHTLLQITIAALAFDASQADSIKERLYTFVEGNTDAEIIGFEVEYR
ncbi:MAG: DUF503 domain-containing protein [Clostridiales bacterium]|nr:DUF503 domain-containing protein [Clostridiales bacterium]